MYTLRISPFCVHVCFLCICWWAAELSGVSGCCVSVNVLWIHATAANAAVVCVCVCRF